MLSVNYVQRNWCYLKDFPRPYHLSLMSWIAYLDGLVPGARTNGNYWPFMFSLLSASDTMRYIAITGTYMDLQHYYITNFQVFMVVFDHWWSTFSFLHYSMVKKPEKKTIIWLLQLIINLYTHPFFIYLKFLKQNFPQMMFTFIEILCCKSHCFITILSMSKVTKQFANQLYSECHLADQAIPHDFWDSDFMAMFTKPATKQHSETYVVKSPFILI